MLFCFGEFEFLYYQTINLTTFVWYFINFVILVKSTINNIMNRNKIGEQISISKKIQLKKKNGHLFSLYNRSGLYPTRFIVEGTFSGQTRE